MIDKKGRIFGKISIIDLIILVAILVLAVGFVLKLNSGEVDSIVSANETFYTTFKVSKVRSFSADAVEIGDLYFEKHAAQLGKVVKFEKEEARDIMIKDDGTVVEVPVEGKFDLYITIECTGRVNDRGYYSNGNRQLNVGSDLTIKSNKLTSSARIFALSDSFQ